MLALGGAIAGAQEEAISEEQLEILRNLPPEQREALIEDYLRSREDGTMRSDGIEQPGARREAERDIRPSDVRHLSPDDRMKREKRLLRDRLQELEDETEPALTAGDTLIVDLELRERDDRTLSETSRSDAIRDRIASRNPYRLDSTGQLMLPGFEPIAMDGLDEELAAKRLAADQDFAEFKVKVTRLELEPFGDEALEPFGYELFTDAPSTFVPASDIPVPPEYVVGPGDQLRVQLFGSTNRALTLTVGRDGQISLPQLGPVSVGGQRFSAVKQDIEARVERQMIGVRASVQMGETRAIRVFLLGEVEQPG